MDYVISFSFVKTLTLITIINTLVNLQEHGQNILDMPFENDEYTSETTPLILAAEKNNYQIVKVGKTVTVTKIAVKGIIFQNSFNSL